MTIKKAVFPVAGLGTRFLPATKVIPKEMLPIVDVPLIQYATDEAIRAGCTELIFVTSPLKDSIRKHFEPAVELEQYLIQKRKPDLLETVRSMVPPQVRCSWVCQQEALGLGHAVLCARSLVGDEPFAVILPDDMIDDNGKGCLSRMVELYQDRPASIIAVENIDPSQTDRYGIVSTTRLDDVWQKIDAIIEKPAPAEAPSTLAVVGRYILSGTVFDYLENTGRGSGGEIQLTDAIAGLLQCEPVMAYEFKGRRFDCGSRTGFIKATINYALKYPDLQKELGDYLSGLFK